MENAIYLFEGAAPGSENVRVEEVTTDSSACGERASRSITGVLRPSIIPFVPEKPNGTAVLVIPGGGYTKLVFDKEGVDIAFWLNSFGVTAFVLKHRMPNDGHENGVDVPLQDTQRAVRIIRSRAEQYGINPGKIGVMGFSAGGHLTSTIGTCFDKKVYEPVDKIDETSARPDFIIPVYAGINAKIWQREEQKFPPRTPGNPPLFNKYPTDELVTENTPPAFILVADDDPTTPAEHSVSFYLALRRAKVPAEMHVFRNGGHGFAIQRAVGPLSAWMGLCREWIESMGG